MNYLVSSFVHRRQRDVEGLRQRHRERDRIRWRSVVGMRQGYPDRRDD